MRAVVHGTCPSCVVNVYYNHIYIYIYLIQTFLYKVLRITAFLKLLPAFLPWSQKCRQQSLRAEMVGFSLFISFPYIYIFFPLLLRCCDLFAKEGAYLFVGKESAWLPASNKAVRLITGDAAFFPIQTARQKLLHCITSTHLPWRYKSPHSLLLSHTPQTQEHLGNASDFRMTGFDTREAAHSASISRKRISQAMVDEFIAFFTPF